MRIKSRINYPHTKVSVSVVLAHSNSAKEEKDVLDQRCSALTVKNMVISVVWPFVQGRRIRNLHAELTVTVKHHQKMKSLNMIHQTHLQILIIPNSQGM